MWFHQLLCFILKHKWQYVGDVFFQERRCARCDKVESKIKDQSFERRCGKL